MNKLLLCLIMGMSIFTSGRSEEKIEYNGALEKEYVLSILRNEGSLDALTISEGDKFEIEIDSFGVNLAKNIKISDLTYFLPSLSLIRGKGDLLTHQSVKTKETGLGLMLYFLLDSNFGFFIEGDYTEGTLNLDSKETLGIDEELVSYDFSRTKLAIGMRVVSDDGLVASLKVARTSTNFEREMYVLSPSINGIWSRELSTKMKGSELQFTMGFMF